VAYQEEMEREGDEDKGVNEWERRRIEMKRRIRYVHGYVNDCTSIMCMCM